MTMQETAGAVSLRSSSCGTATVLLAHKPMCDSVHQRRGWHVSMRRSPAVSAQGPGSSGRGFARHLLPASVRAFGELARMPRTQLEESWPPLFCTEGPSRCWCRCCRRGKVRGPYGRRGRNQAESWVRTCCLDSWLTRGWFCRWCGRDEDSGWQGAARGVYGTRGKEMDFSRDSLRCACGWRFRSLWNWGSCRACYWVLTRQLVRRFVERFGSWSHIHDSIFRFLIETHWSGGDHSTDAMFRADVLAEVQQQGLLLRIGLPWRRREVGLEGQRRFAQRYRIGDVDWIPSSAQHEQVLLWHPPMVPRPREAFARVARELARSAKHPLASAISSRCARALWVVNQTFPFNSRCDALLYSAPCNWCGQFTELSCDGVPPSSTSRGWLCEFRVCLLCRSLYERCRLCCRWTGLPVRAGEVAVVRSQESAEALGRICQEYLRTRRFPFQRLLPLTDEVPLGFQYGDADKRKRFHRAVVRRALCEDAPAGDRRPP